VERIFVSFFLSRCEVAEALELRFVRFFYLGASSLRLRSEYL
jgi:hypothetical protein